MRASTNPSAVKHLQVVSCQGEALDALWACKASSSGAQVPFAGHSTWQHQLLQRKPQHLTPRIVLEACSLCCSPVGIVTSLGGPTVQQEWCASLCRYWVESMAQQGFIGIAMSQSPEYVAPHGSTEPIFGTNPIAVGVPTAGQPLVMDLSTAAAAW